MVLGIDWTVSSQLIEGYSTPNLYGLLFVSGLIIGYFVIRRMFRSEQVPEAVLDKLLIFMVLATIIGARLGHVLFYGPWWDGINAKGIPEQGYFDHPLLILKVWEGGLASHGGAIAILIALYYFSRKISRRPMLWILDRVVAPIAIAGCFIRLGNLVNHEIVGTPTDLSWGFLFTHSAEYGDTYRHPAQLYEALCYLVSFVVLMYMFWRSEAKQIPGRIFGAFMVLIWTARFFIEFVKEGQNDNDDLWLLKTGQLLSIPLILVGWYFLLRKVVPEKQNAYDKAVAEEWPQELLTKPKRKEQE